MHQWMTRLGYLLLVAGFVVVSPLPDLLPVDLFSQRPPSGYFRVVPGEASFTFAGPSLIVIGVLLIGIAKLRRRAG